MASTPGGAAREIVPRLDGRFGPLEVPRRWPPIDELMYTVLSQNTSDANSMRAFESLRARFPTWPAVEKANVRSIAAAIHHGGLANTKAPRIKRILQEIRRRDGSLDLAWTRAAPDAEVRSFLEGLSGVGPKTAACVVAFSLGRPALPVDTHVLRASRRLGLVPAAANAEVAQRILESEVAPDLQVRMHVGLIRLGRTTCKPGIPRCGECPLAGICPTAPKFLGRSGSRLPRSTQGRTKRASSR